MKHNKDLDERELAIVNQYRSNFLVLGAVEIIVAIICYNLFKFENHNIYWIGLAILLLIPTIYMKMHTCEIYIDSKDDLHDEIWRAILRMTVVAILFGGIKAPFVAFLVPELFGIMYSLYTLRKKIDNMNQDKLDEKEI